MGEYFHGWKRKLGVVTLVVVCVLTAGWIRSQTITDRVYLTMKPATISVTALWSYVSLHYHDKADYDWSGPTWNVKFESFDIATMDHIILAVPSLPENSFSFHTFRREGVLRMVHIVFPYWSVVLPLTVLSGWLLLSRQRFKTKLTPTEPAV